MHEPHTNARYEKNGQDDDFWTGIPEGADMIPGAVPIGIEDTATTLSLLNNGTTHFEASDPLTPAMLPVTPGPMTDGTLFPDETPGEAPEEMPGSDADALGPAGDDPLGSWTGVPADEDEIPTQDADDL